MNDANEDLEDLATLRALRQRLRALADDRITLLETMPKPTTWLELTRQFRAIEATDRMLVRLYSPLPRRRARHARGKQPANPPLTHAQHEEIPPKLAVAASQQQSNPSPTLTQSPVMPASSDIVAQATAKVADAINTAVHRCAQHAGVWPDGARYLPGQSGWRKHTLTGDLILPDDDRNMELWISLQTLARCNLVARQAGRLNGVWLDKKPYSDDDPDFFTLSANFGAGANHPAKGERPGLDGLPWWIVRTYPIPP